MNIQLYNCLLLIKKLVWNKYGTTINSFIHQDEHGRKQPTFHT